LSLVLHVGQLPWLPNRRPNHLEYSVVAVLLQCCCSVVAVLLQCCYTVITVLLTCRPATKSPTEQGLWW
jgi:hypothetical protein